MKYINNDYYNILIEKKDKVTKELDKLYNIRDELSDTINANGYNNSIYLSKYEACINLITIERLKLSLLQDFIKNLN